MARPRRNLPGQTTIDAANCTLAEAQVWAGLLDHETGYALREAQALDQGCFTYQNPACPAVPSGSGPVEIALRQSQGLWFAMLTATCDYAYKSYGEATARNTDAAACVRDLVFQRQQVFWQRNTAGCGCNFDPAAPVLHYDREVVPVAFRKRDK